jgi:alkylation response protein AidB-like acyl-CoA dehydrogenase
MSLPNEAHDPLRAALRDFLARHRESPTAPEDFRQWWKALAGLGVFSLAVPAEQDGLGLGVEASALAFEELGRALSPGPLVWAQLAALAVPRPADGHLIATGTDLTARPEGDPVLVEHLAVADKVLILDGGRVLLCDKDALEYTELARPLDPATPVARLDGPIRGEPVGGAEMAERLRRTGTLLSAALLLGISEAALQTATEYAKRREQFDRPIGSFQAVKHLLADCYVRTGLARAALYAAAELETAASAGRGADLSVAKLLCGRAADGNARTAVQVLGGMGFTWETTPHLLLKRAWVLENSFGTGEEHALLVGRDLEAIA